MRRFDKKKHIEKLNKQLNETKFSWNGVYANEEVNEDEYSYPFDAKDTTEKSEDDVDPYAIKEKEGIEEIVVGLGDDIEIDEDCGCSLNQPDPTDVKDSQWFSDVDGERLTDKQVD